MNITTGVEMFATAQTQSVPVAHIDDAAAVQQVLAALSDLHGGDYEFHVGQWTGATTLRAASACVSYYFLIETTEASIQLQSGDLVRGPEPAGPYRPLDGEWASVSADHAEALWPGDTVTVDGRQPAPIMVTGHARYFQVTVAATDYRAPRLAMLRHLTDFPGGCAAYPGAFRREAIPPQRPAKEAPDPRGANRVNQHTLDMRMDRTPTPIRHHHGAVAVGDGQFVNHSETAIVLPRAVYGLPEVDRPDEGHVLIYNRPAADANDTTVIPVRPGSIVVTPATLDHAAGHCFENCFAMLIAIPGFVSPYHFIG
ncbi:MAG: hypothetical protein R3A44_18080 [Caldilineaceae bacterium]